METTQMNQFGTYRVRVGKTNTAADTDTYCVVEWYDEFGYYQNAGYRKANRLAPWVQDQWYRLIEIPTYLTQIQGNRIWVD